MTYSKWCEGRCGLSFRQCLKKQKVDLKVNGKEMALELRRNLSGLFRRNSSERITISHLTPPMFTWFGGK